MKREQGDAVVACIIFISISSLHVYCSGLVGCMIVNRWSSENGYKFVKAEFQTVVHGPRGVREGHSGDPRERAENIH